MAVCQNLVPLVNIKIAGKWMVIPLKMVLIGIDPYPYLPRDQFLVQEKQVEEYKVTVTLADGKDSSDPSDGATKLPLTMAKLETLTDRRSDEAISVQR